jgi:Cu(I)/Ag(I) efflux system periplasmic protein CusF
VKKIAIALISLGLQCATAVAASPQPAEHQGHEMAAMTTAAGPMTDGIVRGIDLGAGTLTVEHGPIPALKMAAMTMPYHVKDAAFLKSVKPGDKIKMAVAVVGGQYTITALQRTP